MRFKLTSEYIEKFGRKAYRIEATCDFDLPYPFGKVKKGDKGGFVEKDEYLKQDRKGWVFENGEIWGGVIYDGVIWGGEIKGGEIRGGVIRGGVIRGGVIWGGEIRGGVIYDGVIYDGVIWGGEIHDGEIYDGVIYDGVIWGGEIHDGEIRGGEDILVFLNIGSENGILTVTRKKDNTLLVNRGCFTGSLDEFKEKVQKTHGRRKQGKAYNIIINYIEYHFFELHKKGKRYE